jgi:Arc/MetJ-type ribon-helix-helix transcriptional regulator
MAELVRIGVVIHDDLLQKFDSLIEKRGYANRSKAFRDRIRYTSSTATISRSQPGRMERLRRRRAIPHRMAPLRRVGQVRRICRNAQQRNTPSERPFGGPQYVLKYLARYTHRVTS